MVGFIINDSRSFIAGVASGTLAAAAAYCLFERRYRTDFPNPYLQQGGAGGCKPRSTAAAESPPQEATSTAAAESSQSQELSNESGVSVEQSAHQILDLFVLPIPHLSAFAPATAIPGRKNRMVPFVGHGSSSDLAAGSPRRDYLQHTSNEDVVIADVVRGAGKPPSARAYVRAGPREQLYFDPKKVKAAIVTCGGLCPGLNNIVHAVTKALLDLYGAAAVLGVRGGYHGFKQGAAPPLVLTNDLVSRIQSQGGTILGSARGGFDLEAICSFCERHDVSQLYVVGGDGTHRAANLVGQEALRRRANLSVAGIPKTIDNDLDLVRGGHVPVAQFRVVLGAALTDDGGHLLTG